MKEEKQVGGSLGRPSGARFRTYERLKHYAQSLQGTLFDNPELHKAVEEIYKYPLREVAKDILNRQLKTGISDEALADLVLKLRDAGRLCQVQDDDRQAEPQLICSLGLFPASAGE